MVSSKSDSTLSLTAYQEQQGTYVVRKHRVLRLVNDINNAYLAKAALTNQINNVVVFHGYSTQSEDNRELAPDFDKTLSVK